MTLQFLATAGTPNSLTEVTKTTPLPAGNYPTTTGGLSVARSLDLQTTATTIKSSAGQLYGWYLANNASSVRYVKLYNKTGATSSDTPVLTLVLPANAAANVFCPHGIAFGTAISARACTGVADNDNTASSTNDVIANFFYA